MTSTPKNTMRSSNGSRLPTLRLELLAHLARQGKIEEFVYRSGIFESLNSSDEIERSFLRRFADRTIHRHSGLADVVYLGRGLFVHFEIAHQNSDGAATVYSGVK